jgi:hypothetical protein
MIRFGKISPHPDSFLTPRRSPHNEGRTEGSPCKLFTNIHAHFDRVSLARNKHKDEPKCMVEWPPRT